MDNTPDNMGRPIPANETNGDDWDGMWDCPECGDHTGNMFKEDEPLKDCLDHIEDGDLREYVRAEYAFLKKGWATKDARIYDLEKKIANLEGQIDGFNILVAKKDGQIKELLEAVDFVKTCLDEKKEGK